MNEKLKRRTIRLSHLLDSELNIIAKKNKVTVNKLISELIKYHINELDSVDETNNISLILKKVEILQKDINDLQKKYNWLNALTKQIFANSGFAKNRDINSDPTFNDFVNNKYKDKYETKFNA